MVRILSFHFSFVRLCLFVLFFIMFSIKGSAYIFFFDDQGLILPHLWQESLLLNSSKHSHTK